LSATHPSRRPKRTGSNEPRRAAQLDARLLFQLSDHAATAATTNTAKHAPLGTLRLVGRTRNISETGLAFIVPTLRIGDDFARAIGSPLLITLYLPSGHVEIRATPVRYEPLSTSSSERGYLIGVRITEMADAEWVRMVEYVRTLR
jgi:hypothetical protein